MGAAFSGPVYGDLDFPVQLFAFIPGGPRRDGPCRGRTLPFLDYRVVEFACHLPPNCRLQGLQDKFILRKVATGLMPPELAHRPKQPYRAPISRCFFGSAPQEYVSDLLSAQAIRQSGYFN